MEVPPIELRGPLQAYLAPFGYTLVECRPVTGRTHQIRAHMASLGHPLVSDTKYKTKLGKRQLKWCGRLFLHALRITLTDVEGAPLEVAAPLPTDLASCLDAMQVRECTEDERGMAALLCPEEYELGRQSTPASV